MPNKDYVTAISNFKQAQDLVKSASELLEDAEDSESAYDIMDATQETLFLVEEVELLLLTGDDFIKTTNLSIQPSFAEAIGLFTNKFTQDIATLNGDKASIQQSINSLKSSDKSIDLQIAQLEGQTSQAKLQMQSAQNNLQQVQVNGATQIENAKFQVESAKNQYESAQAQLNALMAKAKIQELQSQNSINQARKQAETAAVQLRATEIKSPIEGTVTELNFKEGEFAPQGQSLITIESQDQLSIETNVTEDELSKTQEGDLVTIKNSQGQSSKGVISNISNAGSTTSKLFTVEIDIIENNNLRAGTFVRIDFSNETKNTGIIIPISSIFFTKTSKTVYVVNSNNEIEEREIQISRIIGKNIEIKTGLKEGDKLIIEGGRQLNVGDKVEISS